jgi:hypothetical protein
MVGRGQTLSRDKLDAWNFDQHSQTKVGKTSKTLNTIYYGILYHMG